MKMDESTRMVWRKSVIWGGEVERGEMGGVKKMLGYLEIWKTSRLIETSVLYIKDYRKGNTTEH